MELLDIVNGFYSIKRSRHYLHLKRLLGSPGIAGDISLRLEDCDGWRDLSGIVYIEFWLRVVLFKWRGHYGVYRLRY
jgi:hypothetical protein